MNPGASIGIKISAISYFLPETIVSNDDLSRKFGTSSSEIFKKTGVKERRRTLPDFLMSDMAFEAAQQVFDQYPDKKMNVDAILLVGHGFEYKAPVTSALLQHRLGLPTDCFVTDIPHGCTGYIYGLSLAKGLLHARIAKSVLLLTADTPSYVIDQNDEDLLSLFGDSATASIIESVNGIKEEFIFGTNGSGADFLMVKKSGTRNPPKVEWIIESGLAYGKMEMKSTEIFTFALKTVPKLVKDILDKNQLDMEEIDFFVFHQANSFLLEVLRKKLKIPQERFFNDIIFTGNTVSSSIPIALKNAEKNGVLKRGMKVMLAGFGLGLTWGGTVITY